MESDHGTGQLIVCVCVCVSHLSQAQTENLFEVSREGEVDALRTGQKEEIGHHHRPHRSGRQDLRPRNGCFGFLDMRYKRQVSHLGPGPTTAMLCDKSTSEASNLILLFGGQSVQVEVLALLGADTRMLGGRVVDGQRCQSEPE